MNRSRHTLNQPLPPRPTSFRATLSGGNGNGSGHATVENDTQRLERMEVMLAAQQQALETQFTRIAMLQAQVDRLMSFNRELR